MAGEATHPDLINGSLVGILSELEQDKTFLKLAAGDIEASDDVDNSVLAGIPRRFAPGFGRRHRAGCGRQTRQAGSCWSWPPAAKPKRPWARCAPGMMATRTTSPSSKPGKPCRTSV